MIDEEVAARDAAAGRQTYDRDDIMCIKHLIASHHGKLEWEAIKLPAMPEAMMLHELDMIDSRIYIYEETLSKTEPGTLSEPVYGIAADKTSTPLYKRIRSGQ
jgi:3'-5' exoribonuclease